MTIQQAMQAALGHHQAGRFSEAEGLYRQVLGVEAGNGDATYLLGVLLGQRGMYGEAEEMIRRSMKVRAADAKVWNNLGEFCRRGGKLEEAVGAYREALAMKPGYAEAWSNLGMALKELGDGAGAEGAYRKAIGLKGDYAEAHNHLGNMLLERGCGGEAEGAYRRAVALKPKYAEAWSNLGNMLADRGQWGEALGAYQRAVEGNPKSGKAASNLGNALVEVGRVEEGIEEYRRAIGLNGEDAKAYCNLGNALRVKGLLDEAEGACRRALELRPEYAEARANLGSALMGNGKLAEAVGEMEAARALRPGNAVMHSSLIYALYYQEGVEGTAILEKSREWGERHGTGLRGDVREFGNVRDAERRLRVGYVSPDFRRHSVAYFLLPLLEGHDKERVHVTCYANSLLEDEVTGRMRRAADEWRSIVGVSDEAAAEMMKRDGIDVLVDLANHTANNRLLVFARKAAPVQATYLGFPGTTGLSAVDYRVSDGFADPVGMTEGYSVERILRLRRTAWCFEPLSGSPEVGEGPAVRNGYVTFGTFNNFTKVSPGVMELWARILGRVAGSRLVLKNAAMSSASVVERVRGFFAERGIEGGRVELLHRAADVRDHLRLYDRVDIALDTFPYHGTTTTCEALWMGVPVVSLAGGMHASRVGVSLLNNVGVGEWVAGSGEEYVGKAVELAGDVGRLAELRRTLRERMRGSALMDGKGFARDMEGAYREIWRAWCGGKSK